MDATPYTAVIGDLVGSRNYPDRAFVQETLLRVLDEVNQDPGGTPLVRPFRITAGDEFQALTRAPERLVDDLILITERLHAGGFTVSFGLGHGTLSTDLLEGPPGDEGNPGLLDGPCFHRAREAVELAASRRTWAVSRGFDPRTDEALDGLYELMGAVRSGWTELQGNHVDAMRRKGVQRRVAEEYGVSPSVISESLKAARYEAMCRGESGARALLAAFDSQRRGASGPRPRRDGEGPDR